MSYTEAHSDNLPAAHTPCDSCGDIPKERVRLADIVDPATWDVVSVRLCTACRRKMNVRIHDFWRGPEPPIPGSSPRKTTAQKRGKFMVRARKLA